VSYCIWCASHPLHQRYHDDVYGFPVCDDAALLERLALEINQAGLSWLTILKKEEAFRRAFEGFDPERVAAYGDGDVARLLGDAGIIRNRLKIRAVIENARRLLAIRAGHGSFVAWLEAHHPRTREEWQRLFKRTFVFTGGEIVGEFVLSTGALPGAHAVNCPVYARIAALDPPWLRAATSVPNFGWLRAGVLAGMARPRDMQEWRALRAAGIGAVVSLTEQPPSGDVPDTTGLRIARAPIADFGAPTPEQAEEAVGAIDRFLAEGLPVAVHCGAGLGRTGTILACWLVRHGARAQEAIAMMRALRPGSIETAAQEAAVAAFRPGAPPMS
jgi:DNA-3-methyladenine glycosylase I